MIRDNQRYFNRLHVFLDAAMTVFSYFLAWFLWFRAGVVEETRGALDVQVYMAALLFIIPFYVMLYYAFDLYSPKRVQGRRLEIWGVVKANSIGLAGLFSILFVLDSSALHDYIPEAGNFSRGMILVFYFLNIVLDVVMRNIIRIILRNMRKRGYNLKHILLVGYSRAAEQYIDRIKQNPQWGYMIRGILDDRMEIGVAHRGVKVLGAIDNLLYILPVSHLDEIAITLGLEEYYKLEHIVALCEKSGVHTKFIPDYNNIIPTKPYIEDLLGLPVINIRHVPLSNTFQAFIKRTMDLIGSIFCIIIFSPLMLLTVFLIKFGSKGPIIYTQERVGRNNRTFRMYKFRSMLVQDEKQEKKGWTVHDDPRVTPIGKIIRRTSIDELPQLFNVLKGDMSLVGPRPERPQFVEKFREEIPRYMVKHQVRPGMTGWAQINGYRGDTSIKKRIEHDLYYIENWTLGLDIKILLMTIFRVFVDKNAY